MSWPARIPAYAGTSCPCRTAPADGTVDVVTSDDQPSARRAPYALPWHKVDGLTASQLAVLQSLDDARRAGLVADDDATAIERAIREGHPHGARKRLTAAKRRNGGGDAAR